MQYKEWTRWTDEERETVLKMYRDGVKYADIALAVNKSYMAVNGLIKRSNSKTNGSNGAVTLLTKEQEEKRRECHRRGLSDADSAKECGMSQSGYNTWRSNRGLPNNMNNNRNGGRRKSVKKSNRVALTADDAKNYNGNRTKVVDGTTIKEPVRIVDIGLAEKYAQQANARPIITSLDNRLKAKKMVADLCVTASRSFGGDFVRC